MYALNNLNPWSLFICGLPFYEVFACAHQLFHPSVCASLIFVFNL